MADRFALLVAADTFDDPGITRLVGPQNDVDGLAAVLGDPRIGGFDVQRVVNQPSHTVRRELARFLLRRKRTDLVLDYYSGHGIVDATGGDLHFATVDTEPDLLTATAVSAQFIRDVMDNAKLHTTVVVLDCCNSGMYARGMTTKAGDTVQAGARLTGRGRTILTASDVLQYAMDGADVTGAGRRSVFTRILVDGLESGRADLNGDGEVDLDELYRYVDDQVAAATTKQRPRRWVDATGRIVIATSPLGRTTALPPGIEVHLASSFPRIRLAAVDELGRLLADAAHADAATAALRTLADDLDTAVAAAAGALLDPSAVPAGSPRSVTGPLGEQPIVSPSLDTPAAATTKPAPARTAPRKTRPPAPRKRKPADSPVARPSMVAIGRSTLYEPTPPDAQSKGRLLQLFQELRDPPARVVRRTVDAFQVAARPVTNDEYSIFIGATGKSSWPQHWGRRFPPDKIGNDPVVWVSWAAAAAYAGWLAREHGVPYRMPTDDEYALLAQETQWRTLLPTVRRREWTSTQTTRGPIVVTGPGGIPEKPLTVQQLSSGTRAASIGFRLALPVG